MYSSDNIFEILVDFEKEERLRKEYEEAVAARDSGNPESSSLVMDVEKYREEKIQLMKELEETREAVRRLLEDSRIEAEQIKNQARDEGHEIGEREGYEKGYIDGYEKAQQEVEKTLKKEADELLLELRDLIASVEQKKREMLEQYKDDLRDIAISIAEKIIRVSLKSSGDIIKK